MADELVKKRITEYTTEVTADDLDNSDVIFVDSTQHGTRKLRLKGIRDIISSIQNEAIKSSGVSVTADNYATTITNVNNQPVNTIYVYAAGLQSNIANLPSNLALNIMHYTYKYSVATNVGQVQIAIERSGEKPAMYFRTTSGTPVSWGSWVKMANNADIEAIREELDNLDIETDATLSISGKPADAKAAGDEINDLKADFTNTLDYNGIGNAFDGKLYGGYWNADGARVSYQNLDVCNANKIVCPENADVVIEVKTNVESPTYFISYLDDSTRIQRDAGVGKEYSGASPVGTKYVCFTFEKSGLNVSDVQYVGVYINNKINEIDASIKENAANIDEITKTGNIEITSITTKHENEFYNVNNQFYAGGNQWNYYTFPVKQGDTFAIDTVAGGTVRGWAFRDANGNQLSIASYSGDTVQKLYENIVAPANATELIVNFKHVSGYLTISRINAKLVNENDIEHDGMLLPAYLNRIGALTEEKSNILHGKILCCCGDSITYGADMTGDELVAPEIESYQYSAYTKKWTRWTANEPAAYGYQIAARNDMIFYNGGVSGACVQGSGGTSTVPGFSVADGEYTLLPDNIDYLTLFFGWNDTATGALGTINDTTNDSYYGGYNVVLPYLINKYPYTKIALIVPFGTDVGHRQAIRDLANKWGLACFDIYREGAPLYWGKEPDIDVDSSIVTANRTKLSAQANSPHPNIHGHYQISTMLEQFMRGI